MQGRAWAVLPEQDSGRGGGRVLSAVQPRDSKMTDEMMYLKAFVKCKLKTLHVRSVVVVIVVVAVIDTSENLL